MNDGINEVDISFGCRLIKLIIVLHFAKQPCKLTVAQLEFLDGNLLMVALKLDGVELGHPSFAGEGGRGRGWSSIGFFARSNTP